MKEHELSWRWLARRRAGAAEHAGDGVGGVDDLEDAHATAALATPFSAKIVARLLDGLVHRPETTCDVEAAIAALHARPFDVALLDLQMPGGGGQAIADALRAHEQGSGRRAAIVALTALSGERAAARAREGGFDGVLGKPTKPAELQRLLAQLAP